MPARAAVTARSAAWPRPGAPVTGKIDTPRADELQHFAQHVHRPGDAVEPGGCRPEQPFARAQNAGDAPSPNTLFNSITWRSPQIEKRFGYHGPRTTHGSPREEPSKPLYRTSIAGLDSHVGIA